MATQQIDWIPDEPRLIQNARIWEGPLVVGDAVWVYNPMYWEGPRPAVVTRIHPPKPHVLANGSNKLIARVNVVVTLDPQRDAQLLRLNRGQWGKQGGGSEAHRGWMHIVFTEALTPQQRPKSGVWSERPVYAMDPAVSPDHENEGVTNDDDEHDDVLRLVETDHQPPGQTPQKPQGVVRFAGPTSKHFANRNPRNRGSHDA